MLEPFKIDGLDVIGRKLNETISLSKWITRFLKFAYKFYILIAFGNAQRALLIKHIYREI